MKNIFGKIWLVWYGVWFVGLFLLCYPFLYLLLLNQKTYRLADKLRKLWGKVSSYMGLMIPQIHYEQKLDVKKQYVICPNHTSICYVNKIWHNYCMIFWIRCSIV